MWIARDKNGALRLYIDKPVQKQNTKGTEYESWDWCTDMDKMVGYLPSDTFPNLKWEDDPVEVEIVPKKKELTKDDWQIIVQKIKEIEMCSLQEALDTYKSDRDGWVKWYNKGVWKQFV